MTNEGSTMNIQGISFSPTRSAYKIGEKVIKSTGLTKIPSIDLTRPNIRAQFDGTVEGDVVVVSTAVYEGSIPSMILEPLNKLKGQGKWAVPIGVYGARSPEEYVNEMSGLLRKQGFKILAAANFVAEHSYATDEAPAGRGRPTAQDLELAEDFGKKIVSKIEGDLQELSIESKPLKNGENYMRKEWSENGVKKMIAKPEHNAELCIQCNTCVNSCPVAAIDPETYEADGEACIRCMACVKVCPENAKTNTFPQRVAQFMNTWEKDQQPAFFL
jgi:ferredoxin